MRRESIAFEDLEYGKIYEDFFGNHYEKEIYGTLRWNGPSVDGLRIWKNCTLPEEILKQRKYYFVRLSS